MHVPRYHKETRDPLSQKSKGQRSEPDQHNRTKQPERLEKPLKRNRGPRQADNGAKAPCWVLRFALNNDVSREFAQAVIARLEPFRDGIALYHFFKARSCPDDSELIILHQDLGDQRP